MQIRYCQLVSWLSADFPDIRREHIDQYISRWRKVLEIEQPRKGWYDLEDYEALKALGVAYRTLGQPTLRGCEAKNQAREYAATQVEIWRQNQWQSIPKS